MFFIGILIYTLVLVAYLVWAMAVHLRVAGRLGIRQGSLGYNLVVFTGVLAAYVLDCASRAKWFEAPDFLCGLPVSVLRFYEFVIAPLTLSTLVGAMVPLTYYYVRKWPADRTG